MRRHVVLIITLLYVFGTVGMPVAAYSCIDSGEAGVVAYLAMSPRSCYADACCDDEQDPSSVRIESGIPCCDLSLQVAPENNRILIPGQKYGQARPLTDAPVRFDAPRTDVSIAPAPPRILAFHASIKLPLLI
ncbi:MAG: hypothetical protein V3V49_06525 [Candidatus Krumholzibacteria bacterium]